ncbi:PREDICTED: uncharacterized protein LOC104816901 isoform X2 [Tarenaya hassleriana]|uniref:uncharacterized protein LOC104816901 isoform X2 n=1 Tax=Tarenaya hassleriana TaxID=28532 RepID=UPI00053CA8ED|nr:PREDICTED: uncharacterized protein LOC104816901 isoform X2 [Tarenaya hassleriana]
MWSTLWLVTSFGNAPLLSFVGHPFDNTELQIHELESLSQHLEEEEPERKQKENRNELGNFSSSRRQLLFKKLFPQSSLGQQAWRRKILLAPSYIYQKGTEEVSPVLSNII